MAVRAFFNGLAGAGLLLAGLAHGACSASPAASATPVPTVSTAETALTVYWSDGDSGRLSDGTKFRLHGIDAPETGSMKVPGGARCEAERVLGFEARQAAVELTRGKTLSVSATYGTDRYDRAVVRLEIDGRDVAALLVAGGTHKIWDYDGRQRKPDWCAGAPG